MGQKPQWVKEKQMAGTPAKSMRGSAENRVDSTVHQRREQDASQASGFLGGMQSAKSAWSVRTGTMFAWASVETNAAICAA